MISRKAASSAFNFANALVLCGLAVGIANAEDASDVDAKASKTTTYISVSYWDPMTSTVKPETGGSGVIISDKGDVLTAYHVFKSWLKQDEDHKKSNPIKVSIGSKYSEELEASYETGDADADLALIRIRRPAKYDTTPICYVSELAMRAPIVSYGFPNRREITPLNGTFSNPRDPENRWEASIPFAAGMSGGPVYDARGFVVGIIKGGVPESSATSIITPIKWARSMIQSRTDVRPGCFAACALPQHGIASWKFSKSWSQDTEWMGGGHNQAGECGKLQAIYMQTHLNEVLEITATDERSDRDFLGHVTYQYICRGVVQSDPVYIVKEDAACPQ